MQHASYRATELQSLPTERQSSPRLSWLLSFTIVACLSAFFTYEITSQAAVRNFVNSVLPRAQTILRPSIQYAARRENLPFPFGKKDKEDEEEAGPKPSFFGVGAPASKTIKKEPEKEKKENGLKDVVKATGVGAKVVGELALYLAFNTAYFVTNTYQFLTEEEQKKLAKDTVDKQLPELLALLGGTGKAISESASAVAATEEYQDLQKSASEAVEELTKGLKTENVGNTEVIDKLKTIVADEKGEVLSEERKSAILETMKKGGVKATELSLYLFYNVFSVLKNLDKVLPTAEQTSGIEGKIEELEQKVADLATQVAELPSQTGKVAEKVEELKESLPTAEDLANVDPAEVSLSIRSALASTKEKLDETVAAVNKALAEDSDFRKTLNEVSTNLKPVTDAVGSLVNKLPLPKKDDGSIDYSKLLADTGIITVKGLKALIEATKKAASSVNAKTES